MSIATKTSARGNALFLILIAVALFAALSYAVTQSGRGGGSVEKETTILTAAQIVNHIGTLERAIQRLQIINGCNPTDISFNADSDGDGNFIDVDDQFNNPSAPTDHRCHVFRAEGGSVPANAIGAIASVNYTGATQVTGAGCDGTGQSSCNDLLVVFTGISLDVCEAANTALRGVDEASPRTDNFDNTPFTGTYPPTAGGADVITAGAIDYPFAGCVQDSASSLYLYGVILAR